MQILRTNLFLKEIKFPINLQSLRVLRINAELKPKIVRLLTAFCVRTVQLNWSS
jgi:hypothetical protein